MTTDTSTTTATETVLHDFVEKDVQEERTAEIDYDTLLNVHVKTRELSAEEQAQSEKVVFYCRDCKALCEADKKNGKKLKFFCKTCKSEDIYFGSELGVRSFFHLSA